MNIHNILSYQGREIVLWFYCKVYSQHTHTTILLVLIRVILQTCILTMSLSQGAGTGAVGSFLLIAIQNMFFISSLHPSVPTSGQDGGGGAIVDMTWHHCALHFTTEHILGNCPRIKLPTQLIEISLGSLSLFWNWAVFISEDQ